jgi:hypothetical protein
MPTYNLTAPFRDHVLRNVKYAMNKRYETACRPFPLDQQTMQRSILSPWQLETALSLANSGMAMRRASSFAVILPSGRFHPTRHVGVNVATTTPTFVEKSAVLTSHSVLDDYREHQVNVMHTECMTSEQHEEVCIWLKRALAERRNIALVYSTVKEVLANMQTTSDVVAWWPALCGYVSDSADGWSRAPWPWKSRLASPPRDLKRHGPSPEVRAKYSDRIEVSNMLLAGAALMPALPPDKADIEVSVAGWQRLDGDPEFLDGKY